MTCMDARIDPAAALGIELGDAHVIRNAGASARDALRSIIISEQLLGTREIILVKHTGTPVRLAYRLLRELTAGCGMLTFKNENAQGIVEKNLGPEARAELGNLDFLPFPEYVVASLLSPMLGTPHR